MKISRPLARPRPLPQPPSKKDPTIDGSRLCSDPRTISEVPKVETTKDYTILVDNNKYPIINNPIHSVASYENEIKDMIKETKNNIATLTAISSATRLFTPLPRAWTTPSLAWSTLC